MGSRRKVERELLGALEEYLRLEVAGGMASEDTKKTYRSQGRHWLRWCEARGKEALQVGKGDVQEYRAELVEAGYKPSSIRGKLFGVGIFYSAAVEQGLCSANPVDGVKAPKEKRSWEDIRYLTEGELELVLRSIAKSGEKGLRDRLVVGLMGLQGLRTVEVHRASVEDLREEGEYLGLIVRGKSQDRLIYLRPDVQETLRRYLEVRKAGEKDSEGLPLVSAVGNRSGGKRMSRRGIRGVVDEYLRKAEVKRAGLSGHGLRHTAATLAYRYSRDIRGVQEMLGHGSAEMTSRYVGIVEKARENVALQIPVRLG